MKGEKKSLKKKNHHFLKKKKKKSPLFIIIVTWWYVIGEKERGYSVKVWDSDCGKNDEFFYVTGTKKKVNKNDCIKSHHVPSVSHKRPN